MKSVLLLCLAAAARGAAPAAPSVPTLPPPAWEIAEGLEGPESAHYDPGTKALYISNVTGGPGDKDGTGFIAKADLSGKVLALRWARGLNAPKGLRACGGRLYAADINELAVISLATGQVVRKIALKGARMLNDLAAGPDCTIYASDTFAGRIYAVPPKGEPRTLVEGPELQSPNGLALHKGKLYVAAWGPGVQPDWSAEGPGRLLSVSLKGGKVEPVPGPSGNLDGLERDKDSWLVSDWVKGLVYRASADGRTKTVLWGFSGAADIGVAGGLLIVPRMMESKVTAYELSKLPK